MTPPRPIRHEGSLVTIAHLRAAIEAGVAPIIREVGDLRREVADVADDIAALRARSGRRRRWLKHNLGTAFVNGTAGLSIAAASAAATYLITHF